VATVASHMSVRVAELRDTQFRDWKRAQSAARAKYEDMCSKECDPDLQMSPSSTQRLWESESIRSN